MSQSVFHQSPPLTHILKRKREIEERKLHQTFMEGKKEKKPKPKPKYCHIPHCLMKAVLSPKLNSFES